MGGIAVAALSLPICIAYAEIAHLPPESGVYTSIFAFLAYFLLGSSKSNIIGGDSATVTLFASVIIAVSAGNGGLNLQLAVLISITTGILMFTCGFLKLGFISNFLSKPILIGYMNGLALILLTGQLGKFTGVNLEGSNFITQVWDLIHKVNLIHLPTFLVGILSLLILIVLEKISTKIPSPIILLLLSILLARIFNFSKYGIILTQEIRNSFPVFIFPDLNIFLNHFPDIIIASAALVFISYIGEIPAARSFAKDKNAFNPNREFFAMGLADFVIGFFKGYPIGGAGSRAIVSIAAGGKTKMVNLFAATVMFLVIVFFAEEVALIPAVIFGVIIINASIGLFQLKDFFDTRKFSKKEFRVTVLSTVGVLFMGVYQGIILALVLSIIQLIARTSKPPEYELVYEIEKDLSSEIDESNQKYLLSDILIYRYNSGLLFFNSDNFRERISERANSKTDLKIIIIDAQPMNYIDLTGFNALVDVIKEFNSKGIKLFIAGINDKYKKVLMDKMKSCSLDADVFYPNIRSYFRNDR